MTAPESLIWVLRGFGALYVVGGLWGAKHAWFWARLDGDMQRVTHMLENWDGENSRCPDAEEVDRGRHWWVFAGCLITACAGAAMLLGHAAAVPLLALIIVHQLCYFVRQRRRELRAKTPAEAEGARPERSTTNGFFGALVLAVMAAWLFHEGSLWMCAPTLPGQARAACADPGPIVPEASVHQSLPQPWAPALALRAGRGPGWCSAGLLLRGLKRGALWATYLPRTNRGETAHGPVRSRHYRRRAGRL